GTYRYCLLIMSDCVVSPALLKEKIAQGHLSIGIGWSHGYSLLTMHNRFVHLAFRRKSGAEIVLGIPPVRLHLQGRPVMSDGFVNLTLLKKDKPDISMNHPAFRILSQRGAPKRFNVGVRRGLPPRQH